jgi:SEC-C motif-containing protein
MTLCPCGSLKNSENCCSLFINGKALPHSPEELMRSRYTAYTQANIDYIANTMKGHASLNFNPAEAEAWAKHANWLGLKVLNSQTLDAKGFVEFIAEYSMNNHTHTLHEISEFHLENGKWYYVDGSTPKTGRNDPCSCGSGKKYKKCCMQNS